MSNFENNDIMTEYAQIMLGNKIVKTAANDIDVAQTIVGEILGIAIFGLGTGFFGIGLTVVGTAYAIWNLATKTEKYLKDLIVYAKALDFKDTDAATEIE